ncbi:heterokaryon incompatibility [Echria macrotheca]|uniref:Heterokaryon incompatibility n=1 Tax=Echria macrotheca TaxID=438768 RepID=A0AAJ0FA24_9PEZI|nr:heterokaryon incompatibility [Echria macrotheca]
MAAQNTTGWLTPSIHAFIANLIWTRCGLLINLLLLPLWFPQPAIKVAKSYICVWTAGFVDWLYLETDPDLQSSIVYMAIFMSTLGGIYLPSALVPFGWLVMKSAVVWSWNNMPVVITFGLVFGTSCWYFPTALRRLVGAMFNAVTLWSLILLNSAMYYAMASPRIASRHAAAVVARIHNIIWTCWAASVSAKYASMPPPPGPFSYLADGPGFDAASEIRLLELQRRVPFLPLSAKLVSYPLRGGTRTPPPYHAISYVWAHGPQDMRTMLLNGKIFRVRGNVHDILLSCSSFYGPRLVWIDTICINQGDEDEKTRQVREMQTIYARAAHVIICLGGTWAAPALSLVTELQWVQKMWGADYLRGHVAQFRERCRIDPYLRARVRGLVGDIMGHPWFSRVWVVQEAVVAKNATFFYGGAPIQWSELYGWQRTLCDGPVLTSLVGVLSMSSPSRGPLGSAISGFLGFLSMSFIVAYRMEYFHLGPNRLGHVLRVFGDKDAGEALDKVFALVGMTAESEDERLKNLINYKRPREEALLDVANYLLDTGQTLDVIDLTGLRQPGRIPSLPSWAVDWTATRSGMPLNNPFAPQHLKYSASGEKPSNVRRRGDSRNEILVDGQAFDRVAWILPLPEITPAAADDFSAVTALGNYASEALELARQHVPDPYPHSRRTDGTQQDLEEAAWRTLIGDRTQSARPAPESCGRTIKTMSGLLRDLDRLQVQHGGGDPSSIFTDGLLPSSQIQSQLGVTPERQAEIQRAVEEFNNMDLLFDFGKGSITFMFCVTEKNRYIAMVPNVSRPGDTICLLYGVSVPCVLREFDEEGKKDGKLDGGRNKYQLVGDAYVHGVMDGEALGSGDETTFCLC